MKIIISNYDDINNPFYGGGGAMAIHEIAKRLSRYFEIEVITGKYPGSKNRQIDNVNYKRIGIESLGPKAGQILFQLLLPFYSMKLNYDIWIESFTPPISTAFLPIFTKKPVIGLSHLLGAKDMSSKYGIPFHYIENIGLKLYGYNIVLTPYIKKLIRKKNKTSIIEVIPNGVADNVRRSSIKREENYILYMGRIDIEQKGLDMLLSAYKNIATKTRFKLIIAGSGPSSQVAQLKHKIKGMELDNKIKFVGKVVGEKKLELFSHAVLFVMPSRFETLPLTLLEAFYLKVPVVLFNISQLYWLPDGCVLKANVNDVADLSDKMLLLLKSNNLRSKLTERAKKYVKDFNWDVISERYYNFINSTIRNSYEESKN